MLPTVTRPPSPLPDAELLRRFAACRDETAFELLVWRHSALVFGVCRRVLRHRHDAEDATQAAFLVLARRADTVRGPLAGWLARVAYRCALRVANRRGTSLPSPLGGRGVGGEGEPDPDLSALLDAELNRLPDRYRLPVVLCCLKGLKYEEAAEQLNCKPGTLSGRLSRAKAMLRERLLARGFTVSTAGFTALLTGLAESTACSPDLIRTTTAAALGVTAPDRVTAVASGVCRMMALKSLALKSLAGLTAAVFLLGGLTAAGAFATDPPKSTVPANPDRPGGGVKKETDIDRMRGDWVYESSEAVGGTRALHSDWFTVATFADGSVSFTVYLGLVDFKTQYAIDETTTPKQFDMTVNFWIKKVRNCGDGVLKGIYRLEGDTLEICLAATPDDPRPSEFKTGPDLKQSRFTLVRKKPEFDPWSASEFDVKVVDAEGKPVEGANVTGYAQWFPNREGGGDWSYNYGREQKTTKNGTVRVVAFPDFSSAHSLYVRHPERKLVAFDRVSPAQFMNGMTVTVQPEVKLTGRIAYPDSADPIRPIDGVNIFLSSIDGRRLLGNYRRDNEFEFFVPPGDYRLSAYGEHLTKEIPPGQSVFPSLKDGKLVTVGPEGKDVKLEVKPSKVCLLRGKPAPDLGEMVAWRGDEVKLTDLKGKMVLIHFFGTNRFSQITRKMSGLIELHDRFASRGLVVIGVHVPSELEPLVDTVQKLDAKLTELSDPKWLPQDVHFPIALMARPDGPAITAYGTESDSILIDRKGNVVGLFKPGWEADRERLEKMLDEK